MFVIGKVRHQAAVELKNTNCTNPRVLDPDISGYDIWSVEANGIVLGRLSDGAQLYAPADNSPIDPAYIVSFPIPFPI